jgi:16S rRNA C967 or C1407 C5-methylase (RsmB/RsmF family)
MRYYGVLVVNKSHYALMQLNINTLIPNGWLKQLRKDWPEHANDIMAANNQAADLTLRINTRQTTRDRLFGFISRHKTLKPHLALIRL